MSKTVQYRDTLRTVTGMESHEPLIYLLLGCIAALRPIITDGVA